MKKTLLIGLILAVSVINVFGQIEQRTIAYGPFTYSAEALGIQTNKDTIYVPELLTYLRGESVSGFTAICISTTDGGAPMNEAAPILLYTANATGGRGECILDILTSANIGFSVPLNDGDVIAIAIAAPPFVGFRNTVTATIPASGVPLNNSLLKIHQDADSANWIADSSRYEMISTRGVAIFPPKEKAGVGVPIAGSIRWAQENTDTTQLDLDTMKFEADTLKLDTDSLKFEADTLKADTDTLKFEADTLKADTDTLKFEADTLKTDTDNIQDQNEWTTNPPSASSGYLVATVEHAKADSLWSTVATHEVFDFPANVEVEYWLVVYDSVALQGADSLIIRVGAVDKMAAIVKNDFDAGDHIKYAPAAGYGVYSVYADGALKPAGFAEPSLAGTHVLHGTSYGIDIGYEVQTATTVNAGISIWVLRYRCIRGSGTVALGAGGPL